MSAAVLRQAANLMRETHRHDVTKEAETFVAVADWLDFVAEGRESLDGLARTKAWLAQNGTHARPPAEPSPQSRLFLDVEAHALTVARAYLNTP